MSSALSFDDYRARRHIPALDGLRAFAVLGVLLHHSRDKPFWMFHGYRGVVVFFVLSGFLITTLALREESRLGQLNIRAFVIRRAFRILPLYYLTLLAYVVWVLVLHMEGNAQRFIDSMWNYVFYAPEFPIWRSGFNIPFGQAWSLGIEEKFYVVWPLLAFGLLARSPYRIFVTLLLMAGAFALMLQGGWLAKMWGNYFDITLGCLIAQLLHKRATYEKLSLLGATPFAWAAFALLCLATLTGGPGTQWAERVYAVAAAIAIVALVCSRHGPVQGLSLWPLVRIGNVSYAIYLTHAMVFDVVNQVLPKGRIFDALTFGLTVLIVVPICWSLHRLIEKPLIELGRGIASRQYSRSTVFVSNAADLRDGQ